MITTVVIDAQDQDRDKIAAILSAHKGIKVVARGKDGYDALKLINCLKPDIAILDNHLEFIVGEEIPPLLKARSPSTAVAILTRKISEYQLYRAVANEVSAFISKETNMDDLPAIIECISRGECFISPPFAAKILRLVSTINGNRAAGYNQAGMTKTPEPAAGHDRVQSAANGFPRGEYHQQTKISAREDPLSFLSKMELRILTGTGEGFTNEELAEKLNLAVGTVRNYVSAILRKTGLRNRNQMARYSLYYGLVPLYTGNAKNWASPVHVEGFNIRHE